MSVIDNTKHKPANTGGCEEATSKPKLMVFPWKTCPLQHLTGYILTLLLLHIRKFPRTFLLLSSLILFLNFLPWPWTQHFSAALPSSAWHHPNLLPATPHRIFTGYSLHHIWHQLHLSEQSPYAFQTSTADFAYSRLGSTHKLCSTNWALHLKEGNAHM